MRVGGFHLSEKALYFSLEKKAIYCFKSQPHMKFLQLSKVKVEFLIHTKEQEGPQNVVTQRQHTKLWWHNYRLATSLKHVTTNEGLKYNREILKICKVASSHAPSSTQSSQGD